MKSIHKQRSHAFLALALATAPLSSAFAAGEGPVYQFRTFSAGIRSEETPPAPVAQLSFQAVDGASLSVLEFPDTAVGSNSEPLAAVLKNTGTAELTFAQELALPVNFSFASNGCPAQLAPAASCTVSIVFSPAAAQDYAGTLSAAWNGAGGASLALSGKGVQLGITDVVTSAHSAITYVRKTDGNWYSAGYNGYGELGLGDTTNRSTFTRVPGLAGATKVVVGGHHIFAKLANGTWAATGSNSAGRLGLGDTVTRTSFTPVPGLTGVVEVIAGDTHTFAKRADGTWLAAGYNGYGELGLGDLSDRWSFTPVPYLANAAKVVPGMNNTFAMFANGSWSAVGHNSHGQLGVGDTTYRPSFTPVPGITGATEIFVGYSHAVALFPNGTIAGTGRNSEGQLGLSNQTNRSSFTAMTGINNVTRVILGANQTFAKLTDGRVAATGANYVGELGFGDSGNHRYAFTAVPALANAQQVVSGTSQLFAKFADGTWHTVGYNHAGQLGLGDTTTRTTFTPMKF